MTSDWCRRGDLETLGYNLVHWNSGFLPWRNTEDPKQIQIQKNGFLENVDTFLKKCFKPASYPEVLLKYFDYVCQLEFKAKPDYKKLRRILGAALDELGSEPYSKLEFGKKATIITRINLGSKFWFGQNWFHIIGFHNAKPKTKTHSFDNRG